MQQAFKPYISCYLKASVSGKVSHQQNVATIMIRHGFTWRGFRRTVFLHDCFVWIRRAWLRPNEQQWPLYNHWKVSIHSHHWQCICKLSGRARHTIYISMSTFLKVWECKQHHWPCSATALYDWHDQWSEIVATHSILFNFRIVPVVLETKDNRYILAQLFKTKQFG